MCVIRPRMRTSTCQLTWLNSRQNKKQQNGITLDDTRQNSKPIIMSLKRRYNVRVPFSPFEDLSPFSAIFEEGHLELALIYSKQGLEMSEIASLTFRCRRSLAVFSLHRPSASACVLPSRRRTPLLATLVSRLCLAARSRQVSHARAAAICAIRPLTLPMTCRETEGLILQLDRSLHDGTE